MTMGVTGIRAASSAGNLQSGGADAPFVDCVFCDCLISDGRKIRVRWQLGAGATIFPGCRASEHGAAPETFAEYRGWISRKFYSRQSEPKVGPGGNIAWCIGF